MPEKTMAIERAKAAADPSKSRPVMLAVAGDSAAGKTTMTAGLVRTLGSDRVTSVCVDDYHRYDREERKSLPFTPLHPDCNYIDIMEQHLQLLSTGRSILKPVYDHKTGTFGRPVLIEPREFIIIEGLLPLHTELARECFDITVYLDPDDDLRREWKIRRDSKKRGYTPEQVLAELENRESDAASFIRPQRAHADIVVRFAPVEGGPEGEHLSATILLRPTIPHPDLSQILTDDAREALHMKLARDSDGKPVDALHVHGHASRERSQDVERHIWESLGVPHPLPEQLGVINGDARSEPLAITELILLFHMLQSRRRVRSGEPAGVP
ncbi:MAG: phosphoribulokinase [Candidatus Dormibacteria bacterium]